MVGEADEFPMRVALEFTAPGRRILLQKRFGGQAGSMAGSAAHIIYVHGLWMNGAESLFLRRRLQNKLGMPVHSFHYRSVSATMADATARLQAFMQKLAAPEVHLIAHSLGGLVVYRFLERYPEQPPGRVVFLGVPAVASRSALSVSRRLSATPLGRCVAEELLTERTRHWLPPRELGVIAGTKAMGLGRVFTKFDEDSDGTVAVSETRISGATDHLALPVSHMGLLLSPRVAHEAASFFERGRFGLG
jgi:pimeloyl-ACP methyl ester carboxylesterase